MRLGAKIVLGFCALAALVVLGGVWALPPGSRAVAMCLYACLGLSFAGFAGFAGFAAVGRGAIFDPRFWEGVWHNRAAWDALGAMAREVCRCPPRPSPTVLLLGAVGSECLAAADRASGGRVARLREALIDAAVWLWLGGRRARLWAAYLARWVGAFALGFEGGEVPVPASSGRTVRLIEAAGPGELAALTHLFGDRARAGYVVSLEDLRWAAGEKREVYWKGEPKERSYVYFQLRLLPPGGGAHEAGTSVLVFVDDEHETAHVTTDAWADDPSACPSVGVSGGNAGLDVLLRPLLSPAKPPLSSESRRGRVKALETRFERGGARPQE